MLPAAAELRASPTTHELHIEGGGVAVRYDAEGRWATQRRDRLFFRRTVDGEVVCRNEDVVETCEPAAAARLHEEAWQLASAVACRILPRLDPEPSLRMRLLQALDWTPERLMRERGRFASVYPERVAILPPDRYRDLVLLPAVGCPHARCSFCAFHRGSTFRPLSSVELERHIEGVLDLFGRAITGRDGIFLGSGNALALPQPQLLEVLAMVRAAFGARARGVAAFHDPDHSPPRTSAEWRALRKAGLAHVTVGLETGLLPLRRSLGKRGEVHCVIDAVRRQREGGMKSAVTVLAGAAVLAGADEDRHAAATAEVVAAMDLGERDLVYVSALQGAFDGPAARSDATARVARLIVPATRARVAPYRIELFRYYA